MRDKREWLATLLGIGFLLKILEWMWGVLIRILKG